MPRPLFAGAALLAGALLLPACSGGSEPPVPRASEPGTPAPSLPSAPDFDRAQVRQTAGAWCHLHRRYVVVVSGEEDQVGTDVVVRERRTPPSSDLCSPRPGPGDFARPNGDAEYFVGLKGDHLFLDSGTGPDSRDLLVYHIPTRRQVLTLRGYDLAGWRDGATLGVWLQRGEGTREACPDVPEGMGIGIDSLVRLDARTMRVRPTGETRCAARQ